MSTRDPTSDDEPQQVAQAVDTSADTVVRADDNETRNIIAYSLDPDVVVEQSPPDNDDNSARVFPWLVVAPLAAVVLAALVALAVFIDHERRASEPRVIVPSPSAVASPTTPPPTTTTVTLSPSPPATVTETSHPDWPTKTWGPTPTATTQAAPKIDPDKHYLELLKGFNVPVLDPAGQITVGHLVCERLRAAETQTQIADELKAQQPSTTWYNDISTITAANLAYCDDIKASG